MSEIIVAQLKALAELAAIRAAILARLRAIEIRVRARPPQGRDDGQGIR